MKKIYLVFCLSILHTMIYCQGQIFTISNAPNSNVTGASPFQPIIPSMDANLNITTLINDLTLQDVVINEAGFFSYETAILEDVIYSTPFNLFLSSNNNVLGYADLKNDSTGGISLFGLTNVIIGTEINWLPVYGLTPLPVFPPVLGQRPVEIGSLKGNTLVEAGTYAAVVAPMIAGMPTQLGRSLGSINVNVTVLAGNYILIQAGDQDSYAMVGFGSPSCTDDIDANIYMNVEEGNIWVTGSSDNAYAQIGNQQAGAFLLTGDITVVARSVAVNTPQNGNTFLEGGNGVFSEARIGHVHRSNIFNNDVSGVITCVDSSSLVLRASVGLNADASVGHYSSCFDFTGVHDFIFIEAKLFGVLMDASSLTGADPAHCQIGHTSEANFANCYDPIYIETHASVTCFAGGGTSQFTRIGHLANSITNGDLGGHIEINCGDSIVLQSNTGQFNYSHVGHAIVIAGNNGIARGNILIRTGGRQYFTSETSDMLESSVQVGHLANLIFDNVSLLAFKNIEMKSSATAGGGIAKLIAWDTLHIVSADSILVRSNLANSTLEAWNAAAVVWLDAGKDISFESLTGMESAIIASDAQAIRCRAADDILITQSILETNLPTGTIWLESDKSYDPDSLYAAQIVRGGLSNPFPFGTLSSGNLPILSDLLGVIKFENQVQPTVIHTIDGNIDIRSKSTSVDGTGTNLNISSSMSLAIDPMTINGKIFIGMEENAGVLIDLGDSYQNGVIELWISLTSGELFFNVNNEIDVIDSYIQMSEVLFLTN